jgi:hypothetical protein
MASARTENWNGMNWIRQEKRLAIYLRDGLACCWCGAAAEAGVALSLDHIKPASKGGDNGERNLVTSCERCNKSRGNRSARKFAAAVASYIDHGLTAAEVLAHVNDCRGRDLTEYKSEAKIMIARRGSAAKAIQSLNS